MSSQASAAVLSKFTDRLTSLTTNASRESIQTISNYVAFNRKKHGVALVDALSRAIGDAPTPQRKVLYLTVAHEVLVSESSVVMGGGNEKKWERLAELRSMIGENVVVGAVESIRDCCAAAAESAASSSKEVMDRVRTMVDVWEETGAFGGPTIVDSVRRALAAPPKKVAAAAAGEAAAAAPAAAVEGEPSKAGGGKEETSAAQPAAPAVPSTDAKKTEKSAAEGDDAAKVGDAAASESAAATGTNSASTPDDTSSPAGAGAAATTVEGGTTPSKDGKAQQQPRDDAAAASLSGDDDKDDKETDDQESTKDGEGGAAAKGASEEQAKPFDFEAQGIPYEKLEPRDLLHPCKSIATMQISRELRNDTAVQLSSVLAAVPPEVEEACQKALEEADGGDPEKAKVDIDSIPAIPDDILDLDIEESLNNVRLYRDIIVKQRQARKSLINLLVKSRCKFGSDEAAEAFYSMASKAEQVKRRRVLLSDAMELEGLDFVEDEVAGQNGDGAEDGGDGESELQPLSWYVESTTAGGSPSASAGAGAGGEGDAGQQPDAKKARVE